MWVGCVKRACCSPCCIGWCLHAAGRPEPAGVRSLALLQAVEDKIRRWEENPDAELQRAAAAREITVYFNSDVAGALCCVQLSRRCLPRGMLSLCRGGVGQP